MRYLTKQFLDYETYTYTYFIIDTITKESIIIDPVMENFNRDISLKNELNLKIKYIFETHIHADHITSARKIKEKTNSKIVMGIGSNVKCTDILINDNENVYLGDLEIKALSTPGHTDSCTSYYVPLCNFL